MCIQHRVLGSHLNKKVERLCFEKKKKLHYLSIFVTFDIGIDSLSHSDR
jgi:hypothetical protein